MTARNIWIVEWERIETFITEVRTENDAADIPDEDTEPL